MKCADCDNPNSAWASINRGVILCNDCSSIHRQLGKHVSQIKHVTKSKWRKTQLAMLKSLSHSGANKYWEHLLLESSLRQQNNADSINIKVKKPLATDPIHPNKSEFIKEKYMNYGYFKKPRAVSVEDLNQQLHASVRTGFLETSLYLLTLGARPNFQHQTRLTTPLHVATMYNQPLQVELLLTYGGDLLQLDGNGDSALVIAHKKSQSSTEPLKWQLLISCLLEAHFEMTDCLSYFLSRQTIEHTIYDVLDTSRMSNNFLIPTLLTNLDQDHSKNQTNYEQAKLRMKKLSNEAFVELCIDVCDEIERRDANEVILDESGHAKTSLILYFLSPNPNYSSTRNQGRQKLARLSQDEFRKICYDTLVEASFRLSPGYSNSNSNVNITAANTNNTTNHMYYNIYTNNERTDRGVAKVDGQLVSDNNTTQGSNGMKQIINRKHRSSLPLGGTPNCVDDHDPVYDQVAADGGGDYAYVMDLHRSQGSPLPPSSIGGSKHKLSDRNIRISMPPPHINNINNNINRDNDCVDGNGSLVGLLNKVDDLTGRNKLLESRNVELEKRVMQLEIQVRQLTDEKTALMRGMQLECRLRNTSDILGGNSDNGSAYDVGNSDRFNSGPWLRQEVMLGGGSSGGGGGSGAGGMSRPPLAVTSSPTHQHHPHHLHQHVTGAGGSSGSNAISNNNNNTRYDNSDTLQLAGCNDSNNSGSDKHNSANRYNKSDYDIPPTCDEISQQQFCGGSGSGSGTSNLGAVAILPSHETTTPNQVVSSVETIIYHIRTLLDIANGKKRGEFLPCSRAIQSVVQQLVRIFSNTIRNTQSPPPVQLVGNEQDTNTNNNELMNHNNQQHINAALRDLLTNSRDLRVHCERPTGPNDESTGDQPTNSPSSTGGGASVIIHHAHEIARAAKLLLTHYQHHDNNLSMMPPPSSAIPTSAAVTSISQP